MCADTTTSPMRRTQHALPRVSRAVDRQQCSAGARPPPTPCVKNRIGYTGHNALNKTPDHRLVIRGIPSSLRPLDSSFRPPNSSFPRS